MNIYPSTRVWIALSFLVLSNGISAQPDHPFSLGINASIDRPCQKDVKGLKNAFKPSISGFTVGINAQYRLSKKWSLQSGIGFFDRVYTFHDEYPRDTPGQMSTNSLLSIDLEEHSRFIDIPLRVYYTLGNGKLKFLVGAGLNTSIFIEGKSNNTYLFQDERNGDYTTEEAKGWGDEYRFRERFYFGCQLAAGALYQITNRVYLRVEPVYQYLKPIAVPPHYNRNNNHSLGLSVSLNINLK